MAWTAAGELDPSKPVHIVCLGRKGTGKSVMAANIFASWPQPRDRAVLDVTGDVAADWHPEGWIDLAPPIPTRWPEHRRDGDRRMTLRLAPDHRSQMALFDADAFVGLAYFHHGCLLWVDEAGWLAPSNRVPYTTRAALHMGRHHDLSSIWCAPRPKTMDPLVLAQADLVYVFDLPNPDDCKWVANIIGYDPASFTAAVRALRQHEYLR